MKLLRRHSSKSDRLNVVLLVESLSPWPAQHGSLAVQFTRGKRHGQTKPAWPEDENAHVAEYNFGGDRLVIPATLYKNADGTYEDKTLSLFIAQVDDKGKELNVLGGLELNLSDFAAISGRARQKYAVECSSSIWGPAGGRPKLTLSITTAREGENLDVLTSGMAALSTIDEVPSTLSTEVKESNQSNAHSESVRNNPEGDAQVSIGGPVRPDDDSPLGTTIRHPDEEEHDHEYDSDGFLVDSDLAGNSDGPEATRNNSNTIGDESAATEIVKRNLREDLDLANNKSGYSQASATGGTSVQHSAAAAAAAGTVGGASIGAPSQSSVDDRKETSSVMMESSPGLRGGEDQSPPQDFPEQSTHIRRFSRTDGPALGSRKWAWRKQNTDQHQPHHNEGLSLSQSPLGSDQQRSVSETIPDSPVGVSSSPVGSAQGGAAAVAGAGLRQQHYQRSYATPDGASTVSLGLGSASSPGAAALMERELQIAAALESAVYLAGLGWSSSASKRRKAPKIEDLQAPARRLARTIIILGPEEGVAFGTRAIAAIRAAAAASLGDSHRLMLWWATTVTLRWSFWALARGGAGTSCDLPSPGNSHFDWLACSLAPQLRHLEAQLYEDVVHILWSTVLLPAAMQAAEEHAGATLGHGGNSNGYSDAGTGSGLATKAVPISRTLSDTSSRSATSINSPLTHSNTSWEESAVESWIKGLQAVDAAITPVGRPPAAPRPLLSLLRKQALVGVLKRLDGALLEALLADSSSLNASSGVNSPGSARSGAFALSGGLSSSSGGALPAELLPCQRGKLTFHAGVNLKMAVGQLVNWAADAGIREGTAFTHSSSATSASTHSAAVIRAFPRLRELADLLMVPKASLGDEDVRKTVAPSLSPDIIIKVLQRYQPDDTTGDRFPPSLMKQLRSEMAAGHGSAAGAAESDGYDPAPEEVLLEEGLVQPLSLEVSADSDDELSGLEDHHRHHGGRGDARYRLLRELWGSVRAI